MPYNFGCAAAKLNGHVLQNSPICEQIILGIQNHIWWTDNLQLVVFRERGLWIFDIEFDEPTSRNWWFCKCMVGGYLTKHLYSRWDKVDSPARAWLVCVRNQVWWDRVLKLVIFQMHDWWISEFSFTLCKYIACKSVSCDSWIYTFVVNGSANCVVSESSSCAF